VSGTSIEATLELWASSLRDAKARMRPLFTQDRVASSAGQFLDGLLGPERRKTGWMRAEAAGDPGPWRQQAILGRGRWEADALRDIVRAYALETLADPDAVLVVDETGFLKQGKASCGVGRQYTGSAGKITNCRIGVFAAYASRHGHAFIDRALYLPKAWTDDPGGVPFAWVAGDSVYGVSEVEMALRRAGKGYVLGANATQPFNSWIGKPEIAGTAERIAQDLAPSAWRRLSAGEGTKGPRLHDWAYLELADLDADEYRAGATGVWTRGLLIRRSPADGGCAYFTTWCPAGTTIETLVAVEGQRWAIEDAFETAKTELGLDHNETRSWHGWHRHVSLVMLAFAMLAAIRRRANAPPPPKTLINLTRTRRASSAGRSRRFGASPSASRSGASSQPS
jgi:SRSO17 transposase